VKAWRLGKGPAVMLVHGWDDDNCLWGPMIEAFTQIGYAVVALDLPGHGRSPGRMLTMPMAVKAIDAAWRRFGGFDFYCGHSFGGAALACAAAGIMPAVPAHRPQRLVTIGSPSEMAWLCRDLGRLLRLSPAAQAALEAHVEHIAGTRLENFDAATAMASLRLPMLVIHAEDDKEVAADHARRYAAAGPHVTLHWANGFGHRRIVSAEPVIDRIVAFLDAGDRRAAA